MQGIFGADGAVASVGDQVFVCEDALVEVARQSPAVLPTWRFVPATTGGKLLGWRERDDRTFAVVDLHGTDNRLVVFVSDRKIARASRPEHYPRRRPMHTRSR